MFDEMQDSGGAVRPAYAELKDWLGQIPPDVLDYRRREAELLFRRIGITFAVYGDPEAQERLIPFDVIPRIIAAKEWEIVRRGLEQRMKAINAYIKDVYGRREILKAKIVPEDLVFQNPVFRPEMNGQKVPHDIYVHVAGIDIVRVDAETFYVLEDNARTPSGVSYMLENREIMLRLFPELFSRYRIAPVENYPDELLATLKSIAPTSAPGEPTIVLLTPGVYNSAYYEHSFLADKLGIELVEGRDLVTKSDVVYMRTTEGLKRVDVIYRRIDDDFLDPLVFRPDSALGVPGLMSAYQAGNVTLANAVGTGIADDKAVYSYMPQIVKFYLGEEPILKNVPTWRCREAEHLSLCARQHRGAGRERSARLRRLRHADRAEGRQSHHRGVPRQAQIGPEEFHRPADAVAVDLPDLRRGRHCAAPRRSAALRAQRPRPHPHRAGRPDARRAQERLAGGQFQPRRRHQRHLGVGRIRLGVGRMTMLSRTADNLYWLARYVERAEYLARILDTTLRLTALPLAYVGESNEWESAVATAGCAKPFFAAYSEANEETVTEFLAFSTDNPSSIRNCIETARLNARAVRTALTIEMWDSINSAWLELRKWGNGPPSREEFARFLRWVMGSSLSFDGSAYRTMLRNDAYWFSRLGVYIERADNTARILDVKYHLLLPAQEKVGGPLDYFQWASILRSVSALTAYHWVYRQNVKPWLVADLLMLRDEMPRSLASCYENLVQNLDRIAKAYGLQGPAQRHARAVRARLENSKIEEIFQNGLHEFIDDFVEDNNRLGSAVAQQYLL